MPRQEGHFGRAGITRRKSEITSIAGAALVFHSHGSPHLAGPLHRQRHRAIASPIFCSSSFTMNITRGESHMRISLPPCYFRHCFSRPHTGILLPLAGRQRRSAAAAQRAVMALAPGRKPETPQDSFARMGSADERRSNDVSLQLEK